jgi:hypothetical protein
MGKVGIETLANLEHGNSVMEYRKMLAQLESDLADSFGKLVKDLEVLKCGISLLPEGKRIEEVDLDTDDDIDNLPCLKVSNIHTGGVYEAYVHAIDKHGIYVLCTTGYSDNRGMLKFSDFISVHDRISLYEAAMASLIALSKASYTILDKIKVIPSNYVEEGTLYLKGEVQGSVLENIRDIWPRDIHVETLVGTYNHNSETSLEIENQRGTISGDLSNVYIAEQDTEIKKK